MSIEAIKQAVKALEYAAGLISPITKGCQCQICLAHTALRQAIAEAEKQEPVAWIVDGEIKVRLDMAGKLYYSETNVYEKDVVEQAIQQEPVDWDLSNSATVQRARNAVKLIAERNQGVWSEIDRETVHAVNALINFAVMQFHRANTAPVHASDISQERVDETAKRKHEPVAWREVAGKTTKYYDYNEQGRGEPLYAAPQPDLARVGEVGVWGDKREWVGLTDEEVNEWAPEIHAVIHAIEAKLKEKNT